jgi:hypothetical protein
MSLDGKYEKIQRKQRKCEKRRKDTRKGEIEAKRVKEIHKGQK